MKHVLVDLMEIFVLGKWGREKLIKKIKIISFPSLLRINSFVLLNVSTVMFI